MTFVGGLDGPSIQERIAAAATPDEALVLLKESGASPLEAIKALRERFGMTVGDGKMALHTHPAWYAEARAADELHDPLEAVLEDLAHGQTP